MEWNELRQHFIEFRLLNYTPTHAADNTSNNVSGQDYLSKQKDVV